MDSLCEYFCRKETCILHYLCEIGICFDNKGSRLIGLKFITSRSVNCMEFTGSKSIIVTSVCRTATQHSLVIR